MANEDVITSSELKYLIVWIAICVGFGIWYMNKLLLRRSMVFDSLKGFSDEFEELLKKMEARADKKAEEANNKELATSEKEPLKEMENEEKRNLLKEEDGGGGSGEEQVQDKKND